MNNIIGFLDFICIKNNLEFCVFVNEMRMFLDENNKLFLNGFANRKMHELCLMCLKSSLSWFVCDIYAQAHNRASALCLLQCGFKRVKDNIFVYKSV